MDLRNFNVIYSSSGQPFDFPNLKGESIMGDLYYWTIDNIN